MSADGQQGCLKMKIVEYHDCKTLLGPCFISFSIPLFVPGVVLTIVGSYGNESSFPTFGAWHVIGIIILSFASLMLITGILLKCLYRPVISAEIEKHLTPTSSMVTGSRNLGYENDIYSSTNAKMNNKVSHHDLNESHRVVSTHEAKTTHVLKDKNKQIFMGDKKSTQATTVREVRQPDATVVTSTSAPNTNPKIQVPPPSYGVLGPRTSDFPDSALSTSATKTMQGQIQVTAKIVAEVETTQTSGSRDMSSDGGTEQTTFLPEKKRKKKKKRKRHSNLSQMSYQSGDDADGATAETSARQVLPELRVKPVLIHDGEEHQHHDLHVHFRDDTANETIKHDTPENTAHDVSEQCE